MKKIAILIASFINLSLLGQNYQIGFRNVSPVDSARGNRVIQDTKIYYPANTAGTNVPVANGEFPVIVFGHGFTIAWDAYNYIWEYYVPKGYICIFPTTEGGIPPSHSNFGGDLNFLARWIQQQNQLSSSPFYGKVKNKAAVMGHSMGGGCSYLAASGNNVFTTVVSLAAANTNPSAISAAQQVTCPVLNIAGKEDCVTPVNEHQKPIFDSTASSIKYFMELKGASHCNFTSSGASSCFLAEGTSCLGWGPFISRTDQNNRTVRLAERWLEFFLYERCSAWQQFLDTVQTYVSNQFLTANQQMGTPMMPQPPQPTVNGANICIGDTVNLQVTAPNNGTFQWYTQPNGGLPIHTGNSLTINNLNSTTTYYVETISNTCTSNRTAVTVQVFQPQIPIITQNGNQLQSTPALTYQWYLNGNPIPGATTPTYTPTQNGSYSVLVTDVNGCSAMSEPFQYTTTSFSSSFDKTITIYPNPTQGNILQVQTSLVADWSYQIIDLQGRIVKEGKLTNTAIELNEIVNGMYYVKLFEKDFSFISKFIKN